MNPRKKNAMLSMLVCFAMTVTAAARAGAPSAVPDRVPQAHRALDPHGDPVEARCWVRGQGETGRSFFPRTRARQPAYVVGIDDRHGFADPAKLGTGCDFEQFRETIMALDAGIIPLCSFLASDLDGLDAIILLQPYFQNDAGFWPDEISAIHDFVAAGGGLLAIGEGGWGSWDGLDDWNELVAPYGVVYSETPVDPLGRVITDVVPHPVTAGVQTFGVDYSRPFSQISPPAEDLTVQGGDEDVLAAMCAVGGSGYGVFVGDSSLWTDEEVNSDTPITFGDNRLLLENSVSFILKFPGFDCQGGPPDCSDAVAEPASLWPPNHRFIEITITGVTDPDGGSVFITIDSVSQDEPLDAAGDGSFEPDAMVDGEILLLRAERSGLDDGRVYHVAFTAEDETGEPCSGEVTVCVPHDLGQGAACVDEGPLYDSME